MSKVIKNNTNKKITRQVSAKTASLKDTQKEYVESLELSVSMLQKEIESLRNQLNEKVLSKDENKKTKSNYSSIAKVLSECHTNEDLIVTMYSKLQQHYGIIELNLYFFDDSNFLSPVSENGTNSKLNSQVRRMEEQGIIDWVAETGNINIIHNLDYEDSKDQNQLYLILVPIFIQAKVIGFFICKTTRRKEDIAEQELKDLSLIVEYAAFAIDNIRSKEEINKINSKLTGLSSQMLETSKLVTIGEMASAISKEFDSPIKIIKSNVDFLEKGLGEPKRRFEIIKEQITKLLTMNTKLSGLMLESEEEKQSEQIVTNLIDEILLLSETQFLEQDIKIEKNYENNNFKVSVKKSTLEQILLNILHFARESFGDDGGKIEIGVYTHKKGLLAINIVDNGFGLDENELKTVFEPIFSKSSSRKTGIGLYLANEFTKEIKGKLSVIGEMGKGTTYKLILPYSN